MNGLSPRGGAAGNGGEPPEQAAHHGNGHSTTEERLLELIAAKLREMGRSHRWAERKLKLGHGTVANIVARRTSLRFVHLDRFAELFETTPAALLAEAEGDAVPPIVLVKLRLALEQLAAAMQAVEEACRAVSGH